jgi:predicted HicB family RNase H-like nuclease
MLRKKRMGRPPLPKAERRSVKVSFRVTATLHKAVVEAAKREGKSVGKFITDGLVTLVEGGK